MFSWAGQDLMLKCVPSSWHVQKTSSRILRGRFLPFSPFYFPHQHRSAITLAVRNEIQFRSSLVHVRGIGSHLWNAEERVRLVLWESYASSLPCLFSVSFSKGNTTFYSHLPFFLFLYFIKKQKEDSWRLYIILVITDSFLPFFPF